MRRDKLALGVLAILTAVLSGLAREDRVDEKKQLLDDFHKAEEPRRLELLPRLTATYRDDELPSEARFLLALNLLRPHLIWQAPHLDLSDEDRLEEIEKVQEERERG